MADKERDKSWDFEWEKFVLGFWGGEMGDEGGVEEHSDLETVLERIRKLIASGKVCNISLSNEFDSRAYIFMGTLEVE